MQPGWILWWTWYSNFSPRWELCNGQTNCQTSDLSPLMPSCEISVSIWETPYISSSWVDSSGRIRLDCPGCRLGWWIGGWPIGGIWGEEVWTDWVTICRQSSYCPPTMPLPTNCPYCPHIEHFAHQFPTHCLRVHPRHYPLIAHIATSAIISSVSLGKLPVLYFRQRAHRNQGNWQKEFSPVAKNIEKCAFTA